MVGDGWRGTGALVSCSLVISVSLFLGVGYGDFIRRGKDRERGRERDGYHNQDEREVTGGRLGSRAGVLPWCIAGTEYIHGTWNMILKLWIGYSQVHEITGGALEPGEERNSTGVSFHARSYGK